MPADLKAPFNESCCDGGECTLAQTSTQPCGCDPGYKEKGRVVGYLCDYHRRLKEEAEDDGA